MLKESTADFTLPQKGFNNDDSDNQLGQKWVGMVDRCLEQQWKDSQQLLECAKALKNSNNLSPWNLDMIVKELSYLELGIMQRFIDLRQELVNHAYPIKLMGNDDMQGKKNYAHDGGDRKTSADKKLGVDDCWSSSFYVSLPSSPESDIYEPLLSKANTPQKDATSSDYDDEHDDDTFNNQRCSETITGDSPFTLHSKIWQHHRMHQKQPDSLSSSSSSYESSSILVSPSKHLRSLLAPSTSAPTIHDSSQQEDLTTTRHRCSSNFFPASTYNYYPRNNYQQQPYDEMEQQQCQQCFFCRSSMPRQKSFSLNEPDRSVSSSTRSSIVSSQQQSASSLQQDDVHTFAHELPSPPIPIRTSSSLDTATSFTISDPVTKATPPIPDTNTLTSRITPSMPSSSSSMVHTISTGFHFKRNTEKSKIKLLSTTAAPTTAFSHHCTASAIPTNSEHGKSSSSFVRSLIHRKVSFPTLFSSSNKKVHPATTISNNSNDDQSMGPSFLL